MSNAVDTILEQASDWLVLLNSEECSQSDQQAFEQWLQASPQHQEAWNKVELLMSKLTAVPSSVAMQSLDRPVDNARRHALSKLAMLLIAAPVGWGGWRYANSQGWVADYQTAKGEQRDIQLADGSTIKLNTDSAINVQFSPQLRQITLVRGELMMKTGKVDLANRPLRVKTSHGYIEPIGTQFTVGNQIENTFVAVTEGAVNIQSQQAQPTLVKAGQQSYFSSYSIEQPAPIDKAKLAWQKGMLMADKLPLAEFVAELRRYHFGIIRYEPNIANLTVSGAYPITDVNKSLDMLVATYPVKKSLFLGGHWVNLVSSQ